MDFEYEAKLPSSEGKGGKKFGRSRVPLPGTITPQEAQKNKEMMERVINRVKLSSEGWAALREDLDAHMPKDYISKRFGIKQNDLKWLKKALGYS